MSGGATYIAPGVEYSDSGRAVYPDGLYQSLTAFHARYNAPGKTPLRFIVTENGVADDIDVMRPAYIVEHLLAVHAARREVRGFGRSGTGNAPYAGIRVVPHRQRGDCGWSVPWLETERDCAFVVGICWALRKDDALATATVFWVALCIVLF